MFVDDGPLVNDLGTTVCPVLFTLLIHLFATATHPCLSARLTADPRVTSQPVMSYPLIYPLA